jgi:RNA recognition motif-containing protein
MNNFESDSKQEVSETDHNTIYVGNLPFSWGASEVKKMFGRAGEICSVKVSIDRFSGRSQGYGFIEYASIKEANHAIEQFNGIEVHDRKLVVSKARNKKFSKKSIINDISLDCREDRFLSLKNL